MVCFGPKVFYIMPIHDKKIFLGQIPLPFHQIEKKTFANFYSTSNTILLKCLQQFINNKTFENPIYIWGVQGVGCSHLLEACYHEARFQKMKAVRIALKTFQQKYTVKSLRYLTKYQFVCVDELDSIAGQLKWEESLLHMYNDLIAKKAALVFCAHQVPNHLKYKLPDLVSRLNNGLIFQVHALDDINKVAALQRRARLKGFILPETSAKFLLSRWARDAKALFSALETLDYSSLRYQRKLTIPFLKEILNL